MIATITCTAAADIIAISIILLIIGVMLGNRT